MNNFTDLPVAIAAAGLAAVSVYASIKSNGEIGSGWAFISVVLLLSLEGCQ